MLDCSVAEGHAERLEGSQHCCSTATARSQWLFSAVGIMRLRNSLWELRITGPGVFDQVLKLLVSVPSTQPSFVFRFKLSLEFYST